jgi:hypothetical protein
VAARTESRNVPRVGTAFRAVHGRILARQAGGFDRECRSCVHNVNTGLAGRKFRTRSEPRYKDAR